MFNFSNKQTKTPIHDTFSADELGIISEVSASIISTLSLEKLLQVSIQKVVNRYKLLGGLLFLVEKDHLYAKTIAGGMKADLFLKLLNRPISDLKIKIDGNSENYVVKCIKENKEQFSYKVSDFTKNVLSESFSSTAGILTGTKACIALPITYQNKVIGAVFFSKSKKETFEYELPILSLLSTQIGIAIANATLYSQTKDQLKELEDRNVQLEAISRFTNKVISVLDADQLAQTAINSIPEVLGHSTTVYFKLDKKKKTLTPSTYTQNKLTQVAVDILPKKPHEYVFHLDDPKVQDTIIVRAFNEGKALFSDKIQDVARNVVPDFFLKQLQVILKVKCFVAIPVISKGEIIAIICFLVQKCKSAEMTNSQLNTMIIIANQIGIAFENARLYEETKKALGEVKETNVLLEQKYQEEKDIVGILGHELRTPLTVAMGNVEMILKKLKEQNIDPAYLLAKVEKIFDSIIKEREIVETALSTSKIDNEKIILQISEFDIRDVMNYAISAYSPDASEKNLELKLDLPETIPNKVITDKGKLQEIANNLISNAIKYTYNGGVYVSLTSDEKNIYISVRDTGEGIPTSEISNLGQKFYRIHQHLDPDKYVVRAGGTGLGLYVVKSYVTRMGGELKINSKVGKGSTFTAIIPIQKEGITDLMPEDMDSLKDSYDLFEQMGFRKRLIESV